MQIMACKSTQSIKPEERYMAPPAQEASNINIPIQFPLSELSLAVDQQLGTVLYEEKSSDLEIKATKPQNPKTPKPQNPEKDISD